MKTMTVPTRTGTEVITGIELKRFFVHKALVGDKDPFYKWSVTHKATGRAMPHRFKTRAIALQLARRLDDYVGFDALPINDIPQEGLGKTQFQELREYMRKVYDELGV